MKKNIFITATNTDIGKTYATLKLIKQIYKAGLKPGVFKPIETGVSSVAHDGSLLLETCSLYNQNFKKIPIEKIVPYRYPLPAAPFCAKKESKIEINRILEAYREIEAVCDIVLIEGAGGLMVPIEENFFMIDFIRLFDAKTLLVTSDKLGCINDTLLSLEMLKRYNADFIWCVNLRDKEDFEIKTLPFYKKYFGKVLYLQEDIKEIVSLLITDSNSDRYPS